MKFALLLLLLIGATSLNNQARTCTSDAHSLSEAVLPVYDVAATAQRSVHYVIACKIQFTQSIYNIHVQFIFMGCAWYYMGIYMIHDLVPTYTFH